MNSTSVLSSRALFQLSAAAALNTSARLWWLTTALGQWIFMAYIVSFYGPLLMTGVEGLKEAHLANGYMPGDTVGNAALAGHLMFAVIIMGGGPLQLVPQIRAHYALWEKDMPSHTLDVLAQIGPSPQLSPCDAGAATIEY